MRSDSEPEPSGRRSIPPPDIRVALGDLGESGEKVAIVAVGDLLEETALVKGFESRGWEVRLADDTLHALLGIEHHGVRMVVADDFELIKTLRSNWDRDSRPVFVALITWHDDTYRYAKSAGADAALTRPLDNRDALAYWGWD